MKRTKKIALIMLAVALMAVCFVFGASALDATGQCGDNVYWSFNENTGELVIYGEGDMWNYDESPFSFSDVTKIVVEDGVTTIGENAFYICDKLKSVSISNTVEIISEFSFFCCRSLSEVNMSEGLRFIGVNAFFGCNRLVDIVLPDSLTVIESLAFADCSLQNIKIPDNVTYIGELAFSLLPFLKDITIEGIEVELDKNAFCITTAIIVGITPEEYFALYEEYIKGNISREVLEKHVSYFDEPSPVGTIYCHSDSTAEAYAIENGIDYELTHFFEGEWNYDYENNVRTRKCIHCDELQVEELEIEEISGDNFLVVEETVSNGIEGDVEVLKAFDINLKNSEGVHVQPDGSIKVKLPNDWSKSGIYKVYRVNDDGTLTDMNAYRQGSHLVFDTDHFSIYVIVFTPDETTEEEPETPDTPAEPDTSGCMCLCHKTDVFSELLMSIFRFLTKLLGVFPTCQCGVAHY